MARLKHIPLNVSSAAERISALPLGVVIDGPRPGRAAPEADALWLALRSEIDRLVAGGPFDTRRVLELDDGALQVWQGRREAFLRGHFAADARVEVV